MPQAEGLKADFESKLTALESKYLATINQLQTELSKSKAFPTLPDKTSDPQLSIRKKLNTDDSGKVLLQNLPENAKRKLRTKN